MVEITKAKMAKVTILLLSLCLVLVACGDPKLGDMFFLKRTTLGGMNPHSMGKTVDEMKNLEEMGNPDDLEEELDTSNIASFSVGTLVRVTNSSEKHHMVQLQRIHPKTGSRLKMWVDKEELRKNQQSY